MEFNSENTNSESPGMSGILKTAESACSQSGSSLLDFDASLCFNEGDLSFLDDQSSSFTPLPLASQISTTNEFTKTDDVSLLHSILYRLDSIEAAVSTGNSQIHQFNSTFAFLMSKLTSSEEIFVSIKDLKETMKGFVNAILGHVLGKVLGQGGQVVDAYTHTQDQV